MLQSWEAALAGAQPEDRSQGGVTEDASNKIVDVSGVTAGSVPDVSGRESIPSLPVSQYTCPHCRIHLVVGGGGSGAGAHELRSVPALPEPSEVVGLVEKALRRLFDFAYLGESPLASWEITRRLAAERQRSEAGAETPVPGAVTHVERGKALYVLLVQALKTLRPDGKPPDRHAVPRREWYNYLILYESYVEGELNRNIMARLYIGEGTFNRARRAALEAVARTLLEMEAAARQEPSEGE